MKKNDYPPIPPPYKEKFLGHVAWLKRLGINSVLEYLSDTDFYQAPASTRFHGSYAGDKNTDGGLIVHTVNVIQCMLHLTKLFTVLKVVDYTKESAIIVAAFHDICKVDFYIPHAYKDGQFAVDEKPPLIGHGEKSLAKLLELGLSLSPVEQEAIRWHLGAFDAGMSGYPGNFGFQKAMEKPLVRILHLADMGACLLDMRKKNG